MQGEGWEWRSCRGQGNDNRSHTSVIVGVRVKQRMFRGQGVSGPITGSSVTR